jgi:hypothetical protein
MASSGPASSGPASSVGLAEHALGLEAEPRIVDPGIAQRQVLLEHHDGGVGQRRLEAAPVKVGLFGAPAARHRAHDAPVRTARPAPSRSILSRASSQATEPSWRRTRKRVRTVDLRGIVQRRRDLVCDALPVAG